MAVASALFAVAAPGLMGAAAESRTLNEAGRALAEKRYDDALKLYEQARQLDPQSAEIVRYRYGMAGGREHSLAEIAGRLGLSRERVRQIEAEAMSRLRTIAATEPDLDAA